MQKKSCVLLHLSYIFNESQDNPLKKSISGVQYMAQIHLRSNWGILWSQQSFPTRLNFRGPQVHVSFLTYVLPLNLTRREGQCGFFVVFFAFLFARCLEKYELQKKDGGGNRGGIKQERLWCRAEGGRWRAFWRCFSSDTWCLWKFKVTVKYFLFRGAEFGAACWDLLSIQ